jgi:hypothetical protein
MLQRYEKLTAVHFFDEDIVVQTSLALKKEGQFSETFSREPCLNGI